MQISRISVDVETFAYLHFVVHVHAKPIKIVIRVVQAAICRSRILKSFQSYVIQVVKFFLLLVARKFAYLSWCEHGRLSYSNKLKLNVVAIESA